MSKRRHERKQGGPYTALPKAITGASAWRTMSFGARLLYTALRGRLRNDRLNNGKVFLSCRSAAEEIGAARSSVPGWYAENVHYGFLCRTGEGFLGGDGYGIAAKYRFTDLPHGTHPPTRDWEKWDGELFAYTPRKGTTEKQNPVRKKRTPRPEKADIRSTGDCGSVCPEKADIDSPRRCPEKVDISRLPLPQRSWRTAQLARGQGSSTARAPVQAGGAGSSPAPVASLTDYVLRRVNAELDRLHRS
jgi:hypothetical protein